MPLKEGPVGPFPDGADPEEYDRLRRRVMWTMPTGLFVIGSRSALFAPQPDLGLIVIDEEHEWTFKQADQAPRYDAHETADDGAYETFADPRANREIEVRERAAGLGPAMASLPPGQREALELLKLRELSLAEASRASGKSVASLKVSVHRAIRALRAQLTGGGR